MACVSCPGGFSIRPFVRCGAPSLLSHADPRSRLFGIDCRRQPNHVFPARRQHPHRRRHGRRRPHARRDGAHRPHPGQPLAPRPCACHRPAGRQRHPPPPCRKAAAGARACAGRHHRGAAPARLQRRHLARLHAPARRGPPGAAVRRRRSGPGAGTGRTPHRGAAGQPHRAGSGLCGAGRTARQRRLGLHRRHRPQPGAVAATGDAADGGPRHGDGLRRRRTRAGRRSASICARRSCSANWPVWPRPPMCTSPTSSPAK